jgi:hypothetical protein
MSRRRIKAGSFSGGDASCGDCEFRTGRWRTFCVKERACWISDPESLLRRRPRRRRGSSTPRHFRELGLFTGGPWLQAESLRLLDPGPRGDEGGGVAIAPTTAFFPAAAKASRGNPGLLAKAIVVRRKGSLRTCGSGLLRLRLAMTEDWSIFPPYPIRLVSRGRFRHDRSRRPGEHAAALAAEMLAGESVPPFHPKGQQTIRASAASGDGRHHYRSQTSRPLA